MNIDLHCSYRILPYFYKYPTNIYRHPTNIISTIVMANSLLFQFYGNTTCAQEMLRHDRQLTFLRCATSHVQTSVHQMATNTKMRPSSM